MIGTPGRVVAAVVAGSFALAGGAGGAKGAPNGSTRATCHGGSSGFAVSFAGDAKGSSDPVVAARDFVRAGGAGGFGSAASRWRIVPATRDLGGVTVTDGAVFLHAVKVEDGGWAVDSGQHCS